MRRDEVATDNGAAKDGMALVDMGMARTRWRWKGRCQDYRVYLGEEHYLPGFTEKLAGIRRARPDLRPPVPGRPLQRKALAGQGSRIHGDREGCLRPGPAGTRRRVRKSLGADSLAELRAKLKDNLQAEADQKTDEAAEIELLEKLVDGSKFTDVPENLLNEEVLRSPRAPAHGVESQGGRFEDYLSNLKKTRDDLKLEFIPRPCAASRPPSLIKEVAKKEAVEAGRS